MGTISQKLQRSGTAAAGTPFSKGRVNEGFPHLEPPQGNPEAALFAQWRPSKKSKGQKRKKEAKR